MRFFLRLLAPALGALALVFAPSPSKSFAARSQVSMFEEDVHLLSDPQGTMATLQELGVGVVRVAVHWSAIAPNPLGSEPKNFNAADPAAYPSGAWAPYDAVVRAAQAKGITVDFSVTGPPPLWASGPGKPKGGRYPEWKPSAAQYGRFVRAIGTRYSGHYQGLPRVHYWELWNEPNFGQNLAPQATNGSTISTAPAMYRSLVDAGWGALRATGHGHDTIILGNLDARGQSARPSGAAPEGLPGNFGSTKPLQFVRTMYCVNGAYRQLRGKAAAQVGCPTTAAGSRRFRADHPGLFQAAGFADHPYPVNLPPTRASSRDPNFVEFNELPRFAGELDRLQRIYGSGHRFAIYNNEYGYITNPPNNSKASHFVSPATAAGYINWAEYLSWKNSRIASSMQYLLYDPDPVNAPEYGGFASGLIFFNGTVKPTLDAYRLPIFLPSSSQRRKHSLEVWGEARPARVFHNRRAQVQFQRGSKGAWSTIRNVTTDSLGYFDVRIGFPASGSVRMAWAYPAGSGNPLAGQTVYSRAAKLSVR
jgi:hypothetical protein